MTDVETLEFMQRIEQQRAALDADQIKAMAHFTRLRPNSKYVGDEVAAALDSMPRSLV